MDSYLQQTKELAEDILKIEPSQDVKQIPKLAGVYVIYDNKENIIYIGKAVNLNRRINSDHISGENKITTSTFRRKLNKIYKIPIGKEMKEWISKNCYFSFREIPDEDMCSLVEAFLIKYLRKSNSLLNS